MLTLHALRPALYRKYRQAITLALGVAFMLAFHHVRLVHLWLRLVDPGPPDFWLATLQSFTAENLYLFVMWFAVTGNSAGFVVDVSFVAGLLVLGVRGNVAICASPLWPAKPVTMSPEMITVVKTVTAELGAAVFPFFPVSGSAIPTCFWHWPSGSWSARGWP